VLQQLWSDNYKPGATGLEGAYAGKSYWVCTYEWENQLSSYPISTPLYAQAFTTGFSTGFTPTYAIIGYNNKVYYDAYTLDGFTDALNIAIDEFVREGVYVNNPIEDRFFNSDFYEDIDISGVFAEYDNNPFSVSILENSNPEAAGATLNGNILTISGTGGKISGTTITLQAVSGEFSIQEDFKIMVHDPEAFSYLEEGFEMDFPPPFWEIKYNTVSDGGLNGTNLTDPDPAEETWMNNTPANSSYGSDYIHSGENSALIKYWAPDFNWLIMPAIQLDHDDYELKFWLWFSSSQYETKFHVLVNDGTKGWTSVLSYDVSTPDNLFTEEISVSLSEFLGKTIKIAFVYEYSDGYEVAIDDIRVVSPSGINDIANIPEGIELHQNYPNPFNPETDISFTLSEPSDVKLSVYNTKGENIHTLHKGKSAAGLHTFSFDGSDLTSGVYYYRIETSRGGGSVKKMMLLK
jgi:hypothetical protein